MTSSTVVLRPAVAADAARLRDLAGLDSRRLPAGPFLVGEVDGAIVAALSTSDGVAVADPFTFTAGVVALLREHAAGSASTRGRRGVDVLAMVGRGRQREHGLARRARPRRLAL